MNAKILKFTGTKKKPRTFAVSSLSGEILQFPQQARQSLTRRIARDVCRF